MSERGRLVCPPFKQSEKWLTRSNFLELKWIGAFSVPASLERADEPSALRLTIK